MSIPAMDLLNQVWVVVDRNEYYLASLESQSRFDVKVISSVHPWVCTQKGWLKSEKKNKKKEK